MTTPTRLAGAGEVAVYGVLAVVGLVAAILGTGYGLTTTGGRVGPGMVPTVCGGLLAVLGASLLVRTARAHSHRTAEETEDEDARDIFGRTERERVRHLWLVFGLLLATILSVTVLGLIPSFGVFVLVVAAWIERRRPLHALVISVVACGFMYVVFDVFLGVPLPPGLLGV